MSSLLAGCLLFGCFACGAYGGQLVQALAAIAISGFGRNSLVHVNRGFRFGVLPDTDIILHQLLLLCL
jgi:hypothetical protein